MKHAFTLIELLVVMAIIAITGAILFPVFASAKAHAKDVGCISNLSQMGKALALYGLDNEDAIPWGPSEALAYLNVKSADPFFKLPTAKVLLKPYGASEQIFRCPKDWKYVGVDAASGDFIIDASTSFYSRMGSSYRYSLSGPTLVRYLSNVQRPSDTLLAADLYFLHGGDEANDEAFNVVFRDLHTKRTLWSRIDEIATE